MTNTPSTMWFIDDDQPLMIRTIACHVHKLSGPISLPRMWLVMAEADGFWSMCRSAINKASDQPVTSSLTDQEVSRLNTSRRDVPQVLGRKTSEHTLRNRGPEVDLG